MVNPYRNYIFISLILLFYTAIIIMPVYVTDGNISSLISNSLITPLFGIGCLFFIVLYIIIRLHDDQSRQKIMQLNTRLAETEKNISSAEKQYKEGMEKKLFEIGIINASLNREIAERIQAETESRELQKRMELILNSAGEGIFGLDTDGNVTFANTAAAVMTGWELDELVGHPHHELVHHSYENGTPHLSEKCLISQAYRDGIVHFSSDDVFWTKEGTSFPVEYVSTPIIDNSKLSGAVVVFRDKSTFI